MTLAEILAFLNENPTVLKEVLAHVIATPEGKETLDNFAKIEAEKLIGTKVSEIYNGIDKDLAEIMGSFKPGDKKTVDHIKDLANELKTLKANPDHKGGDAKLQERVTELEKSLETAKTWETKYNTAVTEWATKSQEYVTKIETLEGTSTENTVSTDIATGLAGLAFNPNIPETAQTRLVNSVKAEIIKNAKIEDGKVVYYKPDGTKWLNGLYKPVTAVEIFSEELKDILKTDNSGGGANKHNPGKTKEDIINKGGKSTITTIGEGDSAKKRIELDKTKYSNKISFVNHLEEELLANGVARNSQDWKDIELSSMEEYGFAELPRS